MRGGGGEGARARLPAPRCLSRGRAGRGRAGVVFGAGHRQLCRAADLPPAQPTIGGVAPRAQGRACPRMCAFFFFSAAGARPFERRGPAEEGAFCLSSAPETEAAAGPEPIAAHAGRASDDCGIEPCRASAESRSRGPPAERPKKQGARPPPLDRFWPRAPAFPRSPSLCLPLHSLSVNTPGRNRPAGQSRPRPRPTGHEGWWR